MHPLLVRFRERAAYDAAIRQPSRVDHPPYCCRNERRIERRSVGSWTIPACRT